MYKGKRGRRRMSQEEVARKYGFRSGLEERVSKQLEKLNVSYEYETLKIKYVQPEKNRTYTPDFILPNGIIIETKGLLRTEDRQKHKWILDQHPELNIRFVFSNSNSKIRKGSQTTYAMWCEKLGIPYADKEIPLAWIKEKKKETNE
jgi:hypothetical protein